MRLNKQDLINEIASAFQASQWRILGNSRILVIASEAKQSLGIINLFLGILNLFLKILNLFLEILNLFLEF